MPQALGPTPSGRQPDIPPASRPVIVDIAQTAPLRRGRRALRSLGSLAVATILFVVGGACTPDASMQQAARVPGAPNGKQGFDTGPNHTLETFTAEYSEGRAFFEIALGDQPLAKSLAVRTGSEPVVGWEYTPGQHVLRVPATMARGALVTVEYDRDPYAPVPQPGVP